MGNDIVPATPRPPDKGNRGLTLVEFARAAFLSNHFRKKLPNEAAAVVLAVAGQTMGVSWYTAMCEIDLIDGKPSPSANLLRALVNLSPDWEIREVERSNTRCELEWWSRGKADASKWVCVGRSIWTIEDAKAAGLTGKDNWRKYPRAMLFGRATTEGFRAYCPHLAGGIAAYTPDELGAETNEDGEVILFPAKAYPVVIPLATITDEDAAEIKRLLLDLAIDTATFLAHYKVHSVDVMSTETAKKALAILKSRETARKAKEKQDAEAQTAHDNIPDAEFTNTNGEVTNVS